MPVNDLCLDILGTSFFITTDEDPVYLNELLTQYRAAVVDTQKNSGLKDPLKTAILTGFLLCDEIHKLRNRDGSRQEDTEAEKLTLNLIAQLDSVLEKKPPLNE